MNVKTVVLAAVALVLSLSGLAQAGSLSIIADPASVQFGTITDADGVARKYMWFNVVLADAGGYAKIGGLSMAATVTGPGASHLTAPATFGTGGAQSAMRRSGSQWGSLIGSSYALGTSGFTASTSAAIGTLGSGGRLTLAKASDDALVVPVAAGQVLARYYFGWDGQPLSQSVTINLISEKGNLAQGPSVFVDKGDGTVALPEVFSAPASITVGGSSLTAHVAPLAAGVDDWVYQNPDFTAGGHKTSLTVAIDNANGNTSYVVTLTKTGGTGTVTFATTANNLVTDIVGGPRPTNFVPAGFGSCTISVSLHGVQSNETVALGTVTVNVRQFGDINDDGHVDTGDADIQTARLNGELPEGVFSDKAQDLNLDGHVDTGDADIITAILNGEL